MAPNHSVKGTSTSGLRPPEAAPALLGTVFHGDQRTFLKSGGDVENAVFEPAIVVPGCSRLDLVEIANAAWAEAGVPRHLSPFIEDNGDYFCLTAQGEVVYWPHDGAVAESWPNFFLRGTNRSAWTAGSGRGA